MEIFSFENFQSVWLWRYQKMVFSYDAAMAIVVMMCLLLLLLFRTFCTFLVGFGYRRILFPSISQSLYLVSMFLLNTCPIDRANGSTTRLMKNHIDFYLMCPLLCTQKHTDYVHLFCFKNGKMKHFKPNWESSASRRKKDGKKRHREAKEIILKAPILLLKTTRALHIQIVFVAL